MKIATRKIEPDMDQLNKAGARSTGGADKPVAALKGQGEPPTQQELLAYQGRVNQNLALEKLASESSDFDD